jgi:hypothetical protein
LIGYYKKQILRLSQQLQELQSNLDNIQLLVDIQLEIIKRITYTEGRVSHYRTQSKTLRKTLKSQHLPKGVAANVKHDIAEIERKVKKSKWLLFIWRSFGDGLAFAYLDKWAMKPLLYNVDNPQVKQTSGHLTGKKGLDREIILLKRLFSKGVPALLTDLTNTIRHGDVCLLADGDPHLIEVKSSSNTNKRSTRQIECIRSIHSYLETDEAMNVRGVPHIRREELSIPEKNYLNVLDSAVGTALREGLFVTDLEPGTRLVVLGSVSKPDYSAIFSGMERPSVYMLNHAKNEKTWGPYYPFTLSLSTPDHLYAFLHGDVYLIVAFDVACIQQQALNMGLVLSELNDADWAYQIEQVSSDSPKPIVGQISSHFADRMAFELLSWKWVLYLEKARFAQLKEQWPGEIKV